MTTTISKPLMDLTAADVMTPDGLQLTEELPLREAARIMLENQVSGAPVIDSRGRCVGVLSSMDFLRHAVLRPQIADMLAPPRPVTCSFQTKQRNSRGEEITLCTLPSGACPIQELRREGAKGEVLVVCRQPNTVLADWQMVDVEKLPRDAVHEYMTGDPVMVPPTTPIRELARMMIDAHIHRLVVVDEANNPLGIVASTDLLAALAYADDPRL